MIKYLGSKRLLVPDILRMVACFGGARRVLDLFSGTARVGHALKRAGYEVTANDNAAFAYTLARCYVQADRARVIDEVGRRLEELRRVPPAPGYFTETFCERARFFHPRNGARIDAMRERIAEWAGSGRGGVGDGSGGGLDGDVEAVLLVALMEAADRVDSTTGVQMAYLKQWAPRALRELELRLPRVLDGAGVALGLDALEAAAAVEADVAYIDPPYNQHSYLGNYHVWESLVRWDKPEVYGVACKRLDTRARASRFNSRRRAAEAFAEVVAAVRAPRLLVSFSDEGFLARDWLEGLLAERGHLVVAPIDYKRYVGAQIGIHDRRGRKVGRVSHLRNTEYLYAATPDRAEAEALAATLAGRVEEAGRRSQPSIADPS
jgi:adenine-specific DNA-methyltransferase